MPAKINPSEATTTEADARAGYDRARGLTTEWEGRLRAAQTALETAEASATADVIADPGQVEDIVQARADARERVTVTGEVLQQARAAEREAGRKLLPFAADRYRAEATKAEAEADAWRATVNRHVHDLVELTGDDEWEAYAERRIDYVAPIHEITTRAFIAHRSAALIDQAANNGAELLRLVDQAQTDTRAWNMLNGRLGGRLGDIGSHWNNGTGVAAVTRYSLPDELLPGGVFPLY